MNIATIHKTKIGKLPVVILPLELFERLQEDLEMLKSKKLAKDIAKARADFARGRGISLEEVRRSLGLSK